MKYETRERKDKTDHTVKMEKDMVYFFGPCTAKGRERFRDLKLMKKKRGK